ncbi:polyprenyl synthetase family protein [Peptostreptococcus equinus]|uniref:Polyprenyl synthetase family protein n=1 Tax=Peptostreptococcus equinus TaxID=3003601 RepID=A0ABY7JR46_9FIRM|nr:farnesyl diphosphate synthase [Peptostreptococcus sp. CBA3647]WAW15619.1 polyprenyl synthetase family protein [Peptostreptococcus sp. CBA3647]
MDFKASLSEKSKYIEEKIRIFAPKEEGYQKSVIEAMNYSLMAGGKRLRPILIMETYRLCGGKDDRFLPYSIAIEMIHTYSLVHDDLPALDNDDLRRGKPTNHKVYGEAMAILAGDALLNHAFQIMLEGSLKYDKPENSLRAAYEISKGAGIYGMIGGQVVDVESENKKIDKDKLDFIHLNKTAAMIVGSIRSGAILADSSEEKLEALSNYANNIGLAFQIIDDILDIEGDEKILGKHIGSDIDNEKSTYPSIIGMEESKKIAKKLIENAKSELEIFGENAEFLTNLADYIIARDK